MDQHHLETYRSMIALSQGAIKLMSLFNGGAAVALLTFLGNAWDADKPLPNLKPAMWAFGIGLASCGLSAVLTYLTQLALYNEGTKFYPAKEGKLPIWRRHQLYLWVGVITVMSSLIWFCVGIIRAADSFPK